MSAICRFCGKNTGTVLAECQCAGAEQSRRLRLMEADLKDAAFMLLDAEIITISRAAEMMQTTVSRVRDMLTKRKVSTQKGGE